MAKRKDNERDLPGAILMPNGKKYVAAMFRVQCFYEDGTPEDLTLIHPDTYVEISIDPDRNQFLTAYIPEHMLEPNPTRFIKEDDDVT